MGARKASPVEIHNRIDDRRKPRTAKLDEAKGARIYAEHVEQMSQVVPYIRDPHTHGGYLIHITIPILHLVATLISMKEDPKDIIRLACPPLKKYGNQRHTPFGFQA